MMMSVQLFVYLSICGSPLDGLAELKRADIRDLRSGAGAEEADQPRIEL